MKYTNETMKDWLSFADRIVVVTPTDEDISEPAKPQMGQYVSRTVTVTIDEELWARPDAEPFSSPWTYDSFGDGVVDGQDGPVLMRLADTGESRVELGHTYLMSAYFDDHCIKGDPQWAPLGALPFDDGVLGQGEYEGREITLQEATASPPAARTQEQVLDVLAGMNADQIRETFGSREQQKLYTKYRCPGDPVD
jgi:hypothetical protein